MFGTGQAGRRKNPAPRGEGYSLFRSFIRRKVLVPYGIAQIRKKGFWFVDIPRTSSSSIKAELVELYGFTYAKPITRSKDHFRKNLSIFNHHIPALEMRKMLGDDLWKGIFTFTFVRNPWERVLSHYLFRKQFHREIPEEMSFKEYIVRLSTARHDDRDPLFRLRSYYMGAHEYILDEAGNIIVDFIGRYENREEDLKKICLRIGCPGLGSVMLHKSILPRRKYPEYYDEETKDLVGKIYQKDAELFGYTFK